MEQHRSGYRVAEAIDENTIAIMGSACNYGYGTDDPIPELGRQALVSQSCPGNRHGGARR